METRFDAANEWLDRQDVESFIKQIGYMSELLIKSKFYQICNTIFLFDNYVRLYRFNMPMALRHGYWCEKVKSFNEAIKGEKEARIIEEFKSEYARIQNVSRRKLLYEIYRATDWRERDSMKDYFFNLSAQEHVMIDKALTMLDMMGNLGKMDRSLIDDTIMNFMYYFKLAEKKNNGAGVEEVGITNKGKSALRFKSKRKHEDKFNLEEFAEYIKNE